MILVWSGTSANLEKPGNEAGMDWQNGNEERRKEGSEARNKGIFYSISFCNKDFYRVNKL
jgi:hypothetical protein